MDQYTPVRDGLHAIVATLETSGDLNGVLDYEPNDIQVRRLAWILLDSYTRSGAAAGVTSMRYRFMVRVATPVQNSKEAEDELIAAALKIADEIDRNPQFDGAIVEGMAASPDGQTGWINLGAVKCRVVDVFVSALNKYAY